MEYSKGLYFTTFMSLLFISTTTLSAEPTTSVRQQRINAVEISKLKYQNDNGYLIVPPTDVGYTGVNPTYKGFPRNWKNVEKAPNEPENEKDKTTEAQINYFNSDPELKNVYKQLNISRMKAEIRKLQEEDPDLKKINQKLIIKKAENEINIINNNLDVINNVNYIGYFIFIIAHLFLLFGVYAAFSEFKNANDQRKKARTENTSQNIDTPKEQNEFSIGLEGIALKTSLHGTFILAITMVFYYLYLIHVYKVVVI